MNAQPARSRPDPPAPEAGPRPATPDEFRPTWHARSGRLTERKRWALDELAGRHGVPSGTADLAEGRAGVALEIGAGTGEAALALAAARPDLLVVAAEVHKASLARLLLELDDSGAANVRVAVGDGRTVLAGLTPSPTGPAEPVVEIVRVFFPDPWPKRRHHGRRLVDIPFVALAARALRPGGLLELATDHEPYARAMAAAVEAAGGFATVATAGRADRPVTYYEQRALDAGRTVHDLRFRRLPAATGPAVGQDGVRWT